MDYASKTNNSNIDIKYLLALRPPFPMPRGMLTGRLRRTVGNMGRIRSISYGVCAIIPEIRMSDSPWRQLLAGNQNIGYNRLHERPGSRPSRPSIKADIECTSGE